MFRYLLVAIATVCSLSLFAAEPVAAPPPPPTSTIYVSQEAGALNLLDENPVITRRMVDRVVRAVTGQNDSVKAWRSLVAPTDRVGIKIAAAGGRYFASHHGIVEAILDGLEQAGIPRNRVIIWDREADDLQAAGYTSERGGYQVVSVPPSGGFDRTAQFTAPVLGKLIWGDLLFAEKQGKLGKRSAPADQLSSSSYLANVLSKQVTKVINVPVLSDEAGCGVAGAIYNMTVPNLDNWRRFTQTDSDGASGLLDIYADERIGGKVVLTIMDALIAQYASGPRFNPNYAFPYHTIYASKDPLALDSNAFRLIEGWRKEAKLPPIAEHAQWLQMGEQMGLGHFAENKIILHAVDPQ
ncbi:MAG: DUF362 domain-containing protein [Chthoniobacter sp.]|nr:DUF362 domain-containing protein [Chthoniobacter sp.]